MALPLPRLSRRLLTALCLAAASASAAALAPNDPNPGTGTDLLINTSLPSINVAQGVTISASGTLTNYAFHIVNPGAGITVGAITVSGTVESNWDAGLTLRQGNTVTHLLVNPTGRITSAGWYAFYTEWGPATFTTITNLGYIQSSLNEGVHGTLNNFQGGVVGALPYDGNLPANYNVIIRGDAYGQIRFGGGGSTTFGIYDGDVANGIASSTLRGGIYEGVLANIDTSQIANARVGGAIIGSHDTALWSLTDATYRSGSPFDWDLRVVDLVQDLAEPQRAMLEQRRQAVRQALAYDCLRFGPTGWGVALSGRYSGLDETSEGAGALTIAKRLSDTTRAGVFLDRRGTEKAVAGVGLRSGSPLVGAFAAYSGGPGATGLQARLSAASEHSRVDITRTNLVGSAAEVTGRAVVASYGVEQTVGWGVALQDGLVLTPKLGIRYTRAQRDGYAETYAAGQVDDPFAYAAFGENRTTALLGLSLASRSGTDLAWHIGVGYDRDVSRHRDDFAAGSDSFGASTNALATDSRRGHWNVSAGLAREVQAGRTLSLDAAGAQTDHSDNPDFSVVLGYHIAL